MESPIIMSQLSRLEAAACAFAFISSLTVAPAFSGDVVVPAEIVDAMATSPDGRAYVVVVLAPPSQETVRAPSDLGALSRLRSAVDQTTAPVLDRILGADFSLGYRYAHVAAFTGWANAAALDALTGDPMVVAVGPDLRCQGSLASSVPYLGADTVQSMGITGAGITVAVLDSGIDTNHPALSGNIAPGAWHFLDLGQNTGPGAEDQHGHGTNVAGVIASNGAGSLAPGVAPGAQILPIRVLDGNNSGWIADIAAGVDYVVSVSGNYTHLAAINISIGTNVLYSQCPCDTASATNMLVEGECVAARLAGMAIFASSGNEGSCNSMTSPACLSAVSAVAALYDSNLGSEPNSGTYFDSLGGTFPACSDSNAVGGRVTCFSNQSGCNDLAAPGRLITSVGIGGGTSTFTGTSQASPHCAGTAALLCDRALSLGLPAPGPDTIVSLLRSTGQTVIDGCTGNPNPIGIDALAAVNAIVPLPNFVRGDCNDSGSRNLADVVFLLNMLFGSPTQVAHCPQACDASDDGDLDIADAVAELVSLFGNPTIPLAAPSACGPDLTNDPLTCGSFNSCP